MILKNCDANEFIKGLNGRQVICFGAGSTLIEADYEILRIEHLEEYIAFFIDNDQNKCGLKYKYKGLEFDIQDIKGLDKVDTLRFVLLITCASYVEVYQQLKNLESVKDMDCYMYNCICSYPDLDIRDFFHIEINKRPYKDYKDILRGLNLKDKHKGQRCFVIGNGPSLTGEDLELLKGEVTFAANRIFKLFDQTNWRPTYYFCTDYLMYGLDHKEINKIEADLRFVPIERSLAAGKIYEEITYYNRVVNCIRIENEEIVRSTEFEFSEDVQEWVFGGQTVLYDALQFAVYMGVKEIYLLGMDHSYRMEVKIDGTVVENDVQENHFSAQYDEGLEDAIAVVAPLYAAESAYRKAKEVCKEKGITIKNATRGGRLEIFPRICLNELVVNNTEREHRNGM